MSHERLTERAGRRAQDHTILTFHKTQPHFSFGSTNFSPGRMDKLLTLCSFRGFQFVSLNQAINGAESRALTITFDDGYAHLTDALPKLIDRYGIRPTVFIPTAFIGHNNSWDYSSVFQKSPHLDALAIRELAKLGVEFGVHGHNHKDLTRCTPEELTAELMRSRQTLEDILGSPVVSISYPFGRVNRNVLDEAKRAGYKYGFTMSFPTAGDPPLAVGRLPIYGYDTPFAIRQKIERGPLFGLESAKCGITNRLSGGTSLWRRVNGR